MKKVWINFWVDLAMFVSMIGIAGIGAILQWVLPPGSGGGGYGFGRGAGYGREILTVLGMTRHDWGDVHFWLGVVFLLLLLVHIVLHWKWIKCRFEAVPQKLQKSEECRPETLVQNSD